MQFFEDFIFNCMHICGGGVCARECGRGCQIALEPEVTGSCEL